MCQTRRTRGPPGCLIERIIRCHLSPHRVTRWCVGELVGTRLGWFAVSAGLSCRRSFLAPQPEGVPSGAMRLCGYAADRPRDSGSTCGVVNKYHRPTWKAGRGLDWLIRPAPLAVFSLCYQRIAVCSLVLNCAINIQLWCCIAMCVANPQWYCIALCVAFRLWPCIAMCVADPLWHCIALCVAIPLWHCIALCVAHASLHCIALCVAVPCYFPQPGENIENV